MVLYPLNCTAKKQVCICRQFGAGILAHVAGSSCVEVTHGQDGASKRLWPLPAHKLGSIICGEDGCASKSVLSLIRWLVRGGSGNEGGSVKRLGGSGLEEGSRIVGSRREALTDGRSLITLLGGGFEGGSVDEGS